MKQALQRGDDDDVRSYYERYVNGAFDRASLRVHDFKDDGCVIVASAVVHTTHPGFGKRVEPEPSTRNLIREWVAASGNYGSVLTIAPVTLDTDDKQG